MPFHRAALHKTPTEDVGPSRCDFCGQEEQNRVWKGAVATLRVRAHTHGALTTRSASTQGPPVATFSVCMHRTLSAGVTALAAARGCCPRCKKGLALAVTPPQILPALVLALAAGGS
eukprot:1160686-Pelagomonas_calceolata.AAC.2